MYLLVSLLFREGKDYLTRCYNSYLLSAIESRFIERRFYLDYSTVHILHTSKLRKTSRPVVGHNYVV